LQHKFGKTKRTDVQVVEPCPTRTDARLAGRCRRFDSDGRGPDFERQGRQVRIPRIPEEEQRDIKKYVAKMTRADGNTGCAAEIGVGISRVSWLQSLEYQCQTLTGDDVEMK